jgi:hypothetical protein
MATAEMRLMAGPPTARELFRELAERADLTLEQGSRRGGDLKVIWDADNDDEVAAARKTFEEMTNPTSKGGKGFLAFAVGRRGAKAEQIREFDPDAEKLILSPAMAGGAHAV